MLRFHAALGVLLLLGGCAGGGSPPPKASALDAAAPPPAHAVAPIAEPAITPMAEPAAAPAAGPVPPAPPSILAVTAPAAAFVPDARPVPPPPRGTAVGYLVVDLETGRELAALNPDLPLIPASTTKLATAVVALDVLGPEHRFRTELLAAGPVRAGVLEGDLILKGGGDPALDVADLLELAVRLRAAGVRGVTGRFLVDDSALPRLTEIEPTQPPEAAYNPGLGALSLAFNRVRVAWRGGRPVGEAATLPPLAEARFEAAPPAAPLPPDGVELKSAGDDAVVWRVAENGRRRGIDVPVKDAGLHAGHVFHWLALGQGIELEPPLRGAAPPGAIRLAVHESAPLRRLARDMLVYSNNMMAELIGLSAAARLGAVSPDLNAAGALLLERLRRLMPEVDWRGVALGNHSGLDPAARLTPRQLAAIVRYGWSGEALPALLPAGGWSGTLADRFDDGGAALRVWAKTGTLNYGSALAGYLFPEGARPAVFVSMVADIGARAAYDALPRPDAAAEAVAGAWNARARALQDELVEGWLRPLPTS